jgi:hypothetical protein
LRLPKGTSALPIERDAWAFLEAAGITSALQQRAVVQLVRDLKKAQLWTKMKAIYPFVGGTATSHKWNLKDPRDTDAAFRLTFSGGWTHSSTGADPNGTNAYADTNMIASDNTQNSTHFSYYSRQNSNAIEVEIGGRNLSNTFVSLLEIRTSGITYSAINSGAIYTTFSDADSLGYYVASRRASNDIEIYKNDVSKATGSTSSTVTGNAKILLAAFHDGLMAQFYSTKECAFATIGDGFTDAEASLLYQCVDRYQKTLGRAV